MSSTRKEKLMELFNGRARLARTMGMHLSYDEQGRALVDLPYNPGLDHALGGVHGGAIATMLDNAGWFTAAATVERDIWIATSELSLHLLRAAIGTALRARGELLKAGKRQAVCEMRVTDEAGELVAHGTGTFVFLDKLLLPEGDKR